MKFYRYAYYTILSVYKLFNNREGTQRNAVGFFIFIQLLFFIPLWDIGFLLIFGDYNSLFKYDVIMTFLLLGFNFYYFVIKDKASYEEYDNFIKKTGKYTIVIFLLLLFGSFYFFMKVASCIREKNIENNCCIYNGDY